MRPVRFEPTTLGLGTRELDTLKPFVNKHIPHIPEGVGDQKGDQEFLNSKLLELNFAWPSLPTAIKMLIVSIFLKSREGSPCQG
jgi:hypothetical protein